MPTEPERRPFIWLERGEYITVADCGCVLNDLIGQGPAFFMCAMHEGAQEFIGAIASISWKGELREDGTRYPLLHEDAALLLGDFFDAARKLLPAKPGKKALSLDETVELFGANPPTNVGGPSLDPLGLQFLALKASERMLPAKPETEE